MNKNSGFQFLRANGLVLGGALLLATLPACNREAAPSTTVAVSAPAPAPAEAAPATVVVQDDYDYYPGYETYYSRTRHEYVYRDGNTWVRRAQPRGISVDLLLAAPSVHVDFHDSPERHHDSVVRSYPKNWKSTDKKDDDRKH